MSAPASAGFDQTTLNQIAEQARRDDSNCLLVTRHGQLVEEWYWRGTTAASTSDAFSATKSVTSTLVGIAAAEGKLDIRDRVARYLPEWAGTPSADVTIADILSMDSGRHWSRQEDYRGLDTARDQTAYAVGLGQDVPPGTRWVYSNSAVQILDAVLAKATGEDPASYAKSRLFEPLGMTHSAMGHDESGNTKTYTGLRTTCQDLARFGYLFMRDGKWNGKQVVPSAWVRAATGQPSQQFNAAYGYLWWLNRHGPVLSPRQATTGQPGQDDPNGQLVPGAPEDMYWAIGLGGQVVQVDHGSDTVVVRLGTARVNGDVYGPGDTAQVVTKAFTG